jgi:NADH:ubiquinone oxidoreductase subunit 6 (subunit J)
MILLGTPLVKWDDVGKILLAGVVGGVGVVLVFGILLLGLSQARSAQHRGARLLDYAISGLCGALCLAAVAIGIYAMVNKPKSSSASVKGKATIATVRAGPERRGRLVA